MSPYDDVSTSDNVSNESNGHEMRLRAFYESFVSLCINCENFRVHITI